MSMTATKAADKKAEEEKKGSRAGRFFKILGIGLAALALVAGATWWFVLKPGAPEKPKAGAIVQLDSIQINLTDNHYLRLGLALQLTEKAGDEIDGSRALDSAIEMFSGRSMDNLSQAVRREELKEKLAHTLQLRYDGKVMGVYFTEFVTQ